MAFNQLKTEAGASLGYLQTDANDRLGVHNLLHVQDQKAAGVAGGTFTAGAWRTRDFNTVLVNNISGASLAANRITLPAGNYYAEASAPAYYVGGHQVILYNITTGSIIIKGRPMATIGASGGAANVSSASGFFIFDLECVLELQHRSTGTFATSGLGSGLGFTTEVFSDLKIWKVA